VTEVRDAATVIVARDAPAGLEIYLVRRSARSGWLPDRYVFPGGAVDPADRGVAAAGLLRGAAGAVEPAFVVTAARETFEEGGLLFADRPIEPEALSAARRELLAGSLAFTGLLRRFAATLDASLLRLFSRWITPPGEPRRFDTRFFVARAPADQIAEADAREVLDGRWLRPRNALTAHERGELGLIFPTIKHLERIAPFATVADLLAFAAAKPIAPVRPHMHADGTIEMASELENAW